MNPEHTIRTGVAGRRAAAIRDGRAEAGDATTQMIATSHTPGPWRAVEWACKAPTTILADVNGQVVQVAECSGLGRYADDSVADARLIAAAPELRLELQRIADGIAGGFIIRNSETVSPATWDSMIAAIGVVIAKAEGRA
jgi:hypothetical protein